VLFDPRSFSAAHHRCAVRDGVAQGWLSTVPDVADLKPPRADGGEAFTIRMLLQYQRESFARKLDGVDEASARHSPVASGTTLLWLAVHVADAELLWLLVRFAGFNRNVMATNVDTVAAAAARYRATWAQVDSVIDRADGLEAVAINTGEEDPVTLRWILLHLLEETSRHAGHADILRELIDGATGR
jgi:uncharacterized damage-inducible protein DinB